VRAFYDTYLAWADWRARQRKVPLAEYYHERPPLSPALTAFQSARGRAEDFVLARLSRR
jgi:hypothetical protein